MLCAYTRPRYQVSGYRTIGPLVLNSIADAMNTMIGFEVQCRIKISFTLKLIGTRILW